MDVLCMEYQSALVLMNRTRRCQQRAAVSDTYVSVDIAAPNFAEKCCVHVQCVCNFKVLIEECKI
jgi:hypothetical protein